MTRKPTPLEKTNLEYARGMRQNLARSYPIIKNMREGDEISLIARYTHPTYEAIKGNFAFKCVKRAGYWCVVNRSRKFEYELLPPATGVIYNSAIELFKYWMGDPIYLDWWEQRQKILEENP